MDNIKYFENKHNIDLGWLIYFCGMFTLYTKTYIQLALQIFIIIYTLFKIYKYNKDFVFKKYDIITLLLFAMWYGLLLFIAFLSKYLWAVYIKEGSNTVLTLFRIFTISFCLILYVNSKEKVFKILKSYIIGVMLMCLVALFVTPLNQYFLEGDGIVNGFGSKIGMHRNAIGSNSVSALFLIFFLKKHKLFKHYVLSALLLILTIICTGSRGAYLQLILICFLYYFICYNRKKRLTFFIPLLISFSFIYIVLRNIPILYEHIFCRVENLFITLFSENEADSSTLGRMRYQEIAFKMFLRKPILGYGVDGFYSYLANNSTYKYMKAVYSHCNYAELLSCFGLVGFFTWYWMIAYMFTVLIKNIKSSESKYLLVLLIALLIMDYAKINWNTHLTMYLFVILFLLIRININEKKRLRS